MAWENPLYKLSFKRRGQITLISSFFLHFCLGTFYLWGSISTYTTSYLQNHGSNVNKDDAGAVFPFTFLSICIGTIFGVTLANKYGYKKLIFICCFLIGLSVFISGFVVGNFFLFILFYGIIFGILTGLVYMVPFNTCYLFYPKQKGFVSGVITGGFAFGSTAYIWLIFFIVNPSNEKAATSINGGKYYSLEVSDRYPLALKVLGIVLAFIGCASAFFHLRPTQEESKAEEAKLAVAHAAETAATNPKQNDVVIAVTANENHVPAISDPEAEPAIKQHHLPTTTVVETKPESSEDIHYEFQTIKDGLMSPFLYLTCFLALLYTAYGTMMVSQYKNYGEYCGYNDSYLTILGTIGSVLNGVGRIYWGSIFEKFTFRQLMTANLLIQIVLSFTLRWVSQIGILFFISICLGYFTYGAWLSMMPALIARIFGKKVNTTIYAVTFLGYVLASFVQFFFVKILKASIGWGDTFFVFTGIQVFALILSHIIKFQAIPPKGAELVKQHTHYHQIAANTVATTHAA